MNNNLDIVIDGTTGAGATTYNLRIYAIHENIVKNFAVGFVLNV